MKNLFDSNVRKWILEERVFSKVREVRYKQQNTWSLAHDEQHEDFEWLGLITKYVVQGRYIDAAALCIAAAVARDSIVSQE